jgi:hypothetical protein
MNPSRHTFVQPAKLIAESGIEMTKELCLDFSKPSLDEVQDTHEFEHKIALAFPQELSRQQFQLQFILDHFQDIGVVTGGSRTKNLVSHYFDTPKGDLYKSGWALRVRYEEDPKTGVTLNDPDISIKNKGQDFGGTTLRDEYEAKMDTYKNGSKKPVLNLKPMIKKYGNKWARKIGQFMSLNFTDYREVFSINCRRTTFKVCLFSIPQENGQFVIKPEADLTKSERVHGKRMIYEFALDANRFFAPNSYNKIAKDYEIEFELKTHDCEYDPDPDSSDHGVTIAEAMSGRDWIRDHVEALIEERGLAPISHTGLAKSERGELYREAAGITETPYDELTLRGHTDTFYTDKPSKSNYSNDNVDGVSRDLKNKRGQHIGPH